MAIRRVLFTMISTSIILSRCRAWLSTPGLNGPRNALGSRQFPLHHKPYGIVLRQRQRRPHATTATTTTTTATDIDHRIINLSTVTQEELEDIVTRLGHPKYRAKQVWQWIRQQGVTDVEQMNNLPKKLRHQLLEFTKPSVLEVALEARSKDGTVKRAYRCHDGQIIESVLMPYQDGSYTACISSQAGCAQGCVFCATGQMGFSRQLTSDEIYEQVARFTSELTQMSRQSGGEDSKLKRGKETKLNRIVMMGMGEPLANYNNLKASIRRITQELGIGARRITVSTVGIVPGIRKLYQDPDMPPVRLAVSLHCATDEERSALLPANRRYGGLKALTEVLREYMESTGQRITLEWALIEGKNDSVESARTLGKWVVSGSGGGLRRDMVHVNVIPLNPTGGYGGSPSGRKRVDKFCQTLEKEFGIACTPRVRRGIDIDAGCGQLKSKVARKNKKELGGEVTAGEDASIVQNINTGSEPQQLRDFMPENLTPQIGVYEDDDDEEEEKNFDNVSSLLTQEFEIVQDAMDMDSDDFENPEFESDWDKAEAARLIALVEGTTISLSDDVPKQQP